MPEEEAIVDEALDSLREVAQRIRATQNRLQAVGLDEHSKYTNLTHRVSRAPAMTETACVEAP